MVVAAWAIGPVLREPWLELPWPIWGSLHYVAAVSMLIGYSLGSWVLHRGGVARTARKQ